VAAKRLPEKTEYCLDKDCRGGRLPCAIRDGGGFIEKVKRVYSGKNKELPDKPGNLDNLLGGRNGCYN